MGAADRFTALVGIDDLSARQSSAGATRATAHGDDRVLRPEAVTPPVARRAPAPSTCGAVCAGSSPGGRPGSGSRSSCRPR
ncbi:hypothetical protein [Streptomyces sp. NPDC088757]|uniref:hypothetical protein n=1 Tax=Streptomyces sp. NPDC088757 TaxID=3365889 RepID=UPI00380EEF5D